MGRNKILDINWNNKEEKSQYHKEYMEKNKTKFTTRRVNNHEKDE
jgi:hypothetical protein